MKDERIFATGVDLSFKTSRNHSGEYWCLAENELNVTVKASAFLNVLCKYFVDSTCSLLTVKGVFFSLQTYTREGFSQVEVHERVGKSVI